jgi:hypothetical protein
LKYEKVFIKAYMSVVEARGGIRIGLTFYNDNRLRQAVGHRTPSGGFRYGGGLWIGRQRKRVSTSPKVTQQQEEVTIDSEKVLNDIIAHSRG